MHIFLNRIGRISKFLIILTRFRTALITFGNCWKKGLVRLYINGNEVYTVHSNILVTIEFDFKNGDKLELKEHYIGIIRFDDFQIKGCRGKEFSFGTIFM